MQKKLIFVNKDGKTEKHLYPISPREKIFNELWLQELLIAMLFLGLTYRRKINILCLNDGV